jgi:hypothetical protein
LNVYIVSTDLYIDIIKIHTHVDRCMLLTTFSMSPNAI